MTDNSNLIAKSFATTKKPKAYPSSEITVAVEIIQDNFASDAEREGFTLAVKMHGITFLYLTNSPLPERLFSRPKHN